mgnify:CR=1 FL=1|eukprot:scaffold128539_cov31-Tisochrysis_lutea.AAC.5
MFTVARTIATSVCDAPRRGPSPTSSSACLRGKNAPLAAHAIRQECTDVPECAHTCSSYAEVPPSCDNCFASDCCDDSPASPSSGFARSSEILGGLPDMSGVWPRLTEELDSCAMASATGTLEASESSRSARETVLTFTMEEFDERGLVTQRAGVSGRTAGKWGGAVGMCWRPHPTSLTDLPERPEREDEGMLCTLRCDADDCRDRTDECLQREGH